MSPLTATLRQLFAGRRTKLAPALIGHSHSQAIFDAAARDGMALRGFNFWTAPQPALSAARDRFHPEIADVLSKGVVFSAVGGAVHNLMGLVMHPRPFDFVLPERPDLALAEGAEILPYAAIREAMCHALQEYLEIIALVRRAATDRVFHIDAPPPLEDSEHILQDVPWMFFQNLTHRVAPAAVRWKCWRLHTLIVQSFCETQGVEVLSAPANSMNSRGFLKPEFYRDAMHVRENYGSLVLRQMKSVL